MDFYRWVLKVRIKRHYARWLYPIIAVMMAGYAVILWLYPFATVMGYAASITKGIVNGYFLGAGYAFAALVLLAFRPPTRIIAVLMLPHILYTVFAVFWFISGTPGSSPLSAWVNTCLWAAIWLLSLFIIGTNGHD